MRRPTASKLELADLCQYPWAPGVVWSDRESNAAARLGQAFHACVAAFINGTPKPDVGRWNLDEDQIDTLSRMLDGWHRQVLVDPGRWKAEVAFRYNPTTDTATECQLEGERAYPEEDVGYWGTADLVWAEGDRVIVRDWKTGQRENVPFARENPQLRFLALAAARARELAAARVEIGFIDHDGTLEVEGDDLNAFDLAAIAGDIAALEERIWSTEMAPNPGPHCRYCPAVASCPKTHEALVEIAPVPPPEPFKVVGTAGEIASPEHATWLLARLRAVESAAAVVRTALQQYADSVQSGIATGAGAHWKRREVVTERLDVNDNESALIVIERELPGALRRTASKTSIQAAAKAADMPKEDVDAILTRLRLAGAIRVSTTVRYEDVNDAPTPRRRRSK